MTIDEMRKLIQDQRLQIFRLEQINRELTEQLKNLGYQFRKMRVSTESRYGFIPDKT